MPTAHYSPSPREKSPLRQIRKRSVRTVYEGVDYYRDIARRAKLLTAEEEISLSKLIKKGAAADKKLNAEPPPALHEVEELTRISCQGRKALSDLVEANLALVVRIAGHKTAPMGKFSRLDLYQSGNEGLIEAAKRFDHTRGYRFSTYAGWWIRQRAIKCVYDNSRTIRTPPYMWDWDRGKARVKAELDKLGKPYTDDEWRIACGRTKPEWERLRTAFKSVDSTAFIERRGSDPSLCSWDMPTMEAVSEEITPEDFAWNAFVSDTVEKALVGLASHNPVQAEIVKLRIEPNRNGKKRSFREIGEHFSHTPTWAGTLYAKGIAWLKENYGDELSIIDSA